MDAAALRRPRVPPRARWGWTPPHRPPPAIGFSVNYLANVPEVIDLAKETKQLLPDCFVMIGGHSGSFIADELLEHGRGAIDFVLSGSTSTWDEFALT